MTIRNEITPIMMAPMTDIDGIFAPTDGREMVYMGKKLTWALPITAAESGRDYEFSSTSFPRSHPIKEHLRARAEFEKKLISIHIKRRDAEGQSGLGAGVLELSGDHPPIRGKSEVAITTHKFIPWLSEGLGLFEVNSSVPYGRAVCGESHSSETPVVQVWSGGVCVLR